MSCGFRCTQYMVALCLLLSLGLFVTAGAVNYWWITDVFGSFKEEIGLWKTCRSLLTASTCTTRDDLMQFEDGKDKDIILIGVTVAALTTFFALIFVAATMCQRYPSRFTILVETIILFFGVCAGGLALAWALIKIEKDYLAKEGWAFYCLYGGDGMILISFIFSILLLCIRAPGAYRSTNKDDEIAMLAR